MTLDEMCVAAARYSDRYDEFEKTTIMDTDGKEYEVYDDDALVYFNIFRDAINEAYMSVSRMYTMPNTYTAAKVGEDGTIDLSSITPMVYEIKDILNADKTAAVAYEFYTKYVVRIKNALPGDTVQIYYHYIPARLEEYKDEPVFSEAIVDPMVYICLAVARIWQSEKKFDYANQWLQQYYMLLREIKSTLANRADRRIPRRRFR